MRPIVSIFLLGPFLRLLPGIGPSVAVARRIPQIEYPICRRNFTCNTNSQYFNTIMSDLSAESQAEAERLSQPASCKAEILDQNVKRDEALEEVKRMEKAVPKKEVVEKEELKKLTPAEFRVYNSMAEHMNYFHDHFRQSWNLLYNACETKKRPASMSLKQFISTGIQFCSHLSTHHGIEEQHIFPLLAAKMPEFKQGKNAAELLRQHKAIHAGMDLFEAYLRKCLKGETELDLKVLKTKMDSWGGVLWTHLDQEVKTLGAENMRKYWTMDEMRRMPM